MAGGPTSYYPKTNTIVSHRRWECDCVRDNFFKIWKFFPGCRLRRGIRLMRRKRPCPCRGRPGQGPSLQKNLQVGMVWKSEKGERQRPLPREKENRGHGKDADKMKPQTRRNGIARESKSGKTCGTRCSLLKIIARGSWSVERRLPPPASGCSRGIRYGCCPWAVTVRRKAVLDRCQGASYKKKPSKAQALAKPFQKSGSRRGGSLAGSGGVFVREREKTRRNLSECPASDRAKREKASLRAKIAVKLEELPARISAPSGKYEWEDLCRRGEDPVGREHEAGDRTAL